MTTSLILVALLASAQQLESLDQAGDPISLGEFGRLPLSAEVRQADHLMVAMNDDGDALVVWQSQLDSTGQSQVEGSFLWRDQAASAPTWRHLGNLVLGDPSLNLWQDPNWKGGSASSIDECFKPSVVSVGRDFVVSWSRVDTAQSRKPLVIESVLVRPQSTSDVLASPHVLRKAPGRGFPLWNPAQLLHAVYAGDSGQTVGMVRRKGGFLGNTQGQVIVVGVIQTDRTHGSVSVMNTYNLHGWTVDFGASTTSQPKPKITRLMNQSTASAVLVGGVHVDEVGDYSSGGRVPPFVVETKAGGILISHDVMNSHERAGSSSDEAWIELHHFAPGVREGLVVPQGSAILQNVLAPSNYHRRSNFRTLASHSAEEYTIAWLELDPFRNSAGIHASSGSLGSFEIDAAGNIVNIQEYVGYSDPSDRVADPRAFLVDSSGQTRELLVGVNLAAADEFEIYSWESSTGVFDPDFVPEPTSPPLVDPRRPALASQDGLAGVLVFDATQVGGGFRHPVFFIAAF